MAKRRGGLVKLGILSDTHGRVGIARRAVDILRAAGASAYVHCGDVGDVGVLDALAGLDAAYVLGNNDAEDLARYGAAIGLPCLGTGGTLERGGKRIAVTHGDRPATVTRLTRPAEGVHVLLTGHSHVRHDRKVGSVRWINPGALYRAVPKTVAVLDLATDVLEFVEVPDNAD